MERVTLASLVKLAKALAEDQTMYRPGMEINYKLENSAFDILQLEVYMHTYGSEVGFKAAKKFEFDVMDVIFKFSKD